MAPIHQSDQPTRSGAPLPEGDVDLADLAQRLREHLGPESLIGYLEGKTVLRDSIVDITDCSQLQAEYIVDALESQGFARFEGSPTELEGSEAHWRLEPDYD